MTPRILGVSIAVLFLTGCRGAGEEAPAPVRPTAAEPASPAPPPFEGAAPTGEAIAAWLNGAQYRETWELLPGTSPLHEGTEGHGALLTTYVDPVAMEALERAALSMPPGAAFVVEDYLADSTLSSISVMVRVDDPDPESAGWRFSRFGPAGEIEAGPMDACSSCHVLEPDLVFGWELGTPLPIDSTGVVAGPAGNP
jgi:hypothetical protein